VRLRGEGGREGGWVVEEEKWGWVDGGDGGGWSAVISAPPSPDSDS